jgi:SAM-dependent methyltransferase
MLITNLRPATRLPGDRSINVKEVYRQRFSAQDEARKDAIWQEVGRYLQRYVPVDGRVLDIACDRGQFIRHIRASEKWATDLRDVGAALPPDVRFVGGDSLKLSQALPNDYFDLAFISNFLEHLPSTEAVIQQLVEAYKVLRRGGKVLILQPNVRLIGGSYWDFIDHQTPLTDRSLVEAGNLAGFEARMVIKRFLPYTTKSRLPQDAGLVALYLAFRPAWWLLGRQSLYLGEKTE